jgi:hypothetical protein
MDLDSSFILVAEAAGAEVELFRFAFNQEGSGVYVSQPAPVGMPFGMADIGAIDRGFTANIALQFTVSPFAFQIRNLAKSTNT